MGLPLASWEVSWILRTILMVLKGSGQSRPVTSQMDNIPNSTRPIQHLRNSLMQLFPLALSLECSLLITSRVNGSWTEVLSGTSTPLRPLSSAFLMDTLRIKSFLTPWSAASQSLTQSTAHRPQFLTGRERRAGDHTTTDWMLSPLRWDPTLGLNGVICSNKQMDPVVLTSLTSTTLPHSLSKWTVENRPKRC